MTVETTKRMPHRITERTGKDDGRKHVDIQSSEHQRREVADLIQLYFDTDGIEKAEDDIQEVIDGYCSKKLNTERLFTQALYVAIVRSFAILEAKLNGRSHYQMLRRQELETRISALECRPTLNYCGVFEVSRQYSRGQLVTHDGSLWHANEATHGPVPGFSENWTLAVKRGRDARKVRE